MFPFKAEEYQNSLNATKLVWDSGDGDIYDLTYDVMTTPSSLNGFQPFLITDAQGKLVLSTKMFNAALAAGGEAAKKVEIPGVATTASPSSEVGRFFETQSSKGGRYTVTLPDGTKVEELNKATAAMMVPFDSIKFSGNYGNMTEVSYQVAKRAAKKGAKYYHITRQWQERGNNLTVSADLYK